MYKRLASNIRSLYLLQGISYIAPLAVLPYLTRVLGAEAFGSYALALAVAQYLVIITDYGFNLSATRDVAQTDALQAEVSRIFWETQAAKCLLGAVATALLFAVFAAFPGFPINVDVLAAAALAVPGSVAFPVWLYQGLQQMQVLVWSSAVARLLAMMLTFLLVREPGDLAVAVLLSVAVPLLAGVICHLQLMWTRTVAWRAPSTRGIATALRRGWPTFLSTSAVAVYVASVVPVLRAFTDDATVGIYAAAERIVRAAHSLLTPLSSALFPHINSVYAVSPSQALVSLNRYFRFVAPAGAATSALLFLGAEPLTSIAFGVGYAESATILRWLAPLPLVVALSNLFGVQTMLTFGYQRTFLRLVLLAAALYFATIIPFVFWWRDVGAAAAVVLTEAFVTLCMWQALREKGVRLSLFERR